MDRLMPHQRPTKVSTQAAQHGSTALKRTWSAVQSESTLRRIKGTSVLTPAAQYGSTNGGQS